MIHEIGSREGGGAVCVSEDGKRRRIASNDASIDSIQPRVLMRVDHCIDDREICMVHM